MCVARHGFVSARTIRPGSPSPCGQSLNFVRGISSLRPFIRVEDMNLPNVWKRRWLIYVGMLSALMPGHAQQPPAGWSIQPLRRAVWAASCGHTAPGQFLRLSSQTPPGLTHSRGPASCTCLCRMRLRWPWRTISISSSSGAARASHKPTWKGRSPAGPYVGYWIENSTGQESLCE